MTTDDELLAELKATPLDDNSFIGIHRIGCAARAAIPRMIAILEARERERHSKPPGDAIRRLIAIVEERERERDGFRDLFAACSGARDAAGYSGSVPECIAALMAERDGVLAENARLTAALKEVHDMLKRQRPLTAEATARAALAKDIPHD
jgi:hypothetical protein